MLFLLVYVSALKMKVTYSPEALPDFQRTTCHVILLMQNVLCSPQTFTIRPIPRCSFQFILSQSTSFKICFNIIIPFMSKLPDCFYLVFLNKCYINILFTMQAACPVPIVLLKFITIIG
jgi:hypothetical protein